eukprot:SAG31_NODE_8725_length_1392_cov_1.320000_1_plen_112_part_00
MDTNVLVCTRQPARCALHLNCNSSSTPFISTGWSNRPIPGPLTDFNDYKNAMAMRTTMRLLANTTMNAPFFIAQVSVARGDRFSSLSVSSLSSDPCDDQTSIGFFIYSSLE